MASSKEIDVERTAFESWGNDTFNYGFKPDSYEPSPLAYEAQYRDDGTDMAWIAWQAATARAQQAGAGQAVAEAKALRTDEYDVIADRRDLFDFLRAAWREGQHHGGDMDEVERWNKATDHATSAINVWATLRHMPQSASLPPQSAAQADDRFKDICEAIIDIWDDGQRPYDDRSYLANAWDSILTEARAATAKSK